MRVIHDWLGGHDAKQYDRALRGMSAVLHTLVINLRTTFDDGGENAIASQHLIAQHLNTTHSH